MSEFDERERAYERKFEMDEEQKFKVIVRTAHLFGQWVAGQLGLTQVDAETYARQFVDGVVAKPGHELALVKAEKDLQAKGANLGRHRLEKEYEAFHRAAHEQIQAGK